MPLAAGQILGNRYRVDRLLGAGGMGAVYLATHLGMGTQCAIKENTIGEISEQFRQEARLLFTLKHQGLPKVTDYFEEKGGQYLVMEFVPGQDLDDLLEARRAPFPEDEVRSWAIRLLEVLEYLHSQQPPIIHRDIKPANIKRTPDGRLVLVDFGLAKQAMPGQATTLSAKGLTWNFAPIEQYPPEMRGLAPAVARYAAQVRGQGYTTGPYSDLYSLGATMYYLLTLHVPPSVHDRIAFNITLPPLRQLNPAISPEMEAVVSKALALHPRDRFQKAVEMRQALQRPARPQPAPRPKARPISPASAHQTRVLRTLTGHAAGVIGVAFSPDGKLLTTGSYDGTARLWRVADGAPLRVITERLAPVRSLAFSPDWSVLASGTGDRAVLLWSLTDGSLRRTLSKHTQAVLSLSFSWDGAILASGSMDKTICLWRVVDGVAMRVLRGHGNWVRSLAFSPDRSLLASGSLDKTIRLWRVDNGRLLRALTGHTDTVASLCFSPDGTLLASGGLDNTVRLWRVADGRLLHILAGHTDSVLSVVFSPDGAILASGGRDRAVRLWRVSDGALLSTLTGSRAAPVLDLAFSPDGAVIAAGTGEGTVRVWG